MKVEAEIKKQKFRPIRITFTLETQKELDALGSLFNTTSIIKGLNRCSNEEVWRGIYSVFEDAGADIYATILD